MMGCTKLSMHDQMDMSADLPVKSGRGILFTSYINYETLLHIQDLKPDE